MQKRGKSLKILRLKSDNGDKKRETRPDNREKRGGGFVRKKGLMIAKQHNFSIKFCFTK